MEFKYALKRMNVVKVTNDKDTRDKLIAQGFKLVEKSKVTDKPKDDGSKEDVKETEKPKEDVKVEEKPKK